MTEYIYSAKFVSTKTQSTVAIARCCPNISIMYGNDELGYILYSTELYRMVGAIHNRMNGYPSNVVSKCHSGDNVCICWSSSRSGGSWNLLEQIFSIVKAMSLAKRINGIA